MTRDFGRYTFHINRHYLSNFALGFDYYQLYSFDTEEHQASICQINLLFFNITITRWVKWI